MINDWFVVHDGLISASRFPLARPQQRISAAELVLLFACGAVAAAAVAYVKLSLQIPGHSIVLAALPMVFGLSLAPRRLAGSVMSAGALGTAWVLSNAGGVSYGSGAFVSLSLIGPMMDLAVRHARTGWRVYAALVLSGVATNLLALGSRASFKFLGLDAGARPFDSWWLQASITYTLSGIVAGLLGALCWFQFNDRSRRGSHAGWSEAGPRS
jgi:hypothetical protein